MRIAVIGAGIGGLAVAAGLQRDGHEVEVLEERAEPAATGSGLTLFGNAFAALDVLGIGDRVRAVSSTSIATMRAGHRAPDGARLATAPASATATLRSVHRAELHSALLAALAPGSLRTGVTATIEDAGRGRVRIAGVGRSADRPSTGSGGGVDRDAGRTDGAGAGGAGEPGPIDGAAARVAGAAGRIGGAGARADAGGPTREYDLVVAADGIRSRARAALGDDPGLRYSGYTAWRGVTAAPFDLAGEAGETWGAGARFGLVPLPDGRVYWFATATAPAGFSPGDHRAEAAGLVAGWHAPIGALIAATAPDAVLRHDIHDLRRVPRRFTAGRAALLGDAAHAMTPDLGQGAGLAIEDAGALVALLRAHSPDEALARYDALRRPRAVALHRRSRLMGRVGQWSNPLARGLRDALLRATPPAAVGRAAASLQRWTPPAAPEAVGRRGAHDPPDDVRPPLDAGRGD
ncbi:MAG: NAD(P)-binding protein [Microbacteriaceae bacterium]|nr:NAD(P)-binding protein [Microbacteriaceae bacterium]